MVYILNLIWLLIIHTDLNHIPPFAGTQAHWSHLSQQTFLVNNVHNPQMPHGPYQPTHISFLQSQWWQLVLLQREIDYKYINQFYDIYTLISYHCHQDKLPQYQLGFERRKHCWYIHVVLHCLFCLLVQYFDNALGLFL